MTLEDQVLRVFRYRAPNKLIKDMLYIDLPKLGQAQIDAAIDLLEKKGILIQGPPNAYSLQSLANVPIRKYIKVGATRFRRILVGDPLLPEPINMQVEMLAKYADSLESRFRSLISKRMRSYWANIIIVFGVFVALFSFVLVSVSKIQIDDKWTFWDIVLKNVAQLLPLAAVLGAFAVLLKILFR
jgi:hypothetical protein